MLGLIYKDFLVIRKQAISLLSGVVVSILLFLPWTSILEKHDMLVGAFNGETMAFAVMPLTVYGSIYGVMSQLQDHLFEIDEKKVYSAFVISTPVTKKGQVLSKYYEVLFLYFVVVMWGMVCDLISSCVLGTVGSAMSIYVSLFFLFIFLRAIEIPFYVRYGVKHGSTIKVIMLLVISIIALVYLMFGKLPDMGSDSVFDRIVTWLLDEKNLSTASFGAISLFPYVSMGAYYLSYRISLKLYQKGVESYDC